MKRYLYFFSGFPVLLAMIVIFACIRSSEAPEWNVLWISIDDVRADHLGCYGYNRALTPSLDSLAEQGVRFNRCISQSSWTLPSYASMLTSRFPYEVVLSQNYLQYISNKKSQSNGQQKSTPLASLNTQWYSPLREGVPTIAQALQTHGLITAGWTNSPWLAPKTSKLDRGFDEYVTMDQPERHYIDAENTLNRVQKWIENHRNKQWFVFVHLLDPHIPWRKHPGMYFGDRYIDQYDAELAFTDQAIGRLFSWMQSAGLWDRTMVIINADHGEAIYEDDSKFVGHGTTVRDEVIRVPLIMRLPEGPRNSVVSDQVRNIDIFPTILDCLGIETVPGIQGLSLRGHIEGRPSPDFPDTALTMAMLKGDEMIVLTTMQYRLVYFPKKDKFYSHPSSGSASDEEKKNEQLSRMANELKLTVARIKETLSASGARGKPLDIDDESLDVLKSLGYL